MIPPSSINEHLQSNSSHQDYVNQKIKFDNKTLITICKIFVLRYYNEFLYWINSLFISFLD